MDESTADNTEPRLLGNEEVGNKCQTEGSHKTIYGICAGCSEAGCQAVQFPIGDSPLNAENTYGADGRRDGYTDD